MAFDLHTEVASEWHEINMTPLVDVMLVLLVIFMVTLPAWPQALGVQLPSAHSTDSSPPHPVVLVIDAQGNFALDHQAVSAEQLLAQLQAQHQRAGDTALRIEGDQSVPYARVAQALASAREAGWQQVALGTRAVAP